jgi:hypothetical protein
MFFSLSPEKYKKIFLEDSLVLEGDADKFKAFKENLRAKKKEKEQGEQKARELQSPT